MVTFMGVLWMVLGACLATSPLSAGLVSVTIVGVLLSLAGLGEIGHGIKMPSVLLRVTWFLMGLGTFACGALVMKIAWADLVRKLMTQL